MTTKTILTTPQSSATTGDRPARSRGRIGLVLALVVVGLVLGGAGAWIAQIQNAAGHVAPGVQVADLPVAGLAVADADAAIAKHFGGLADRQMVIRSNTRAWTFPARDLGISLDLAATAQAARQAGRTVQNPATVPLVLHQDRATAEATLQTVAADVAVAPQDAQLTVDADGVRVQTAQSGQRLDVDGTWAAILAATQQYPFGDITLKLAPVPPRVHDADIAAALATVHRLSDKPVTLTGRGADGSVHTWTLDAPTLRRWLQISQDANGTAVVQSRLDDRKITTYLEGIAGDLKHEAQNATLALPNYATSALLTPDLTGQQLSLVASRDHVQAAAQADDGRRTADLVTEPVPAAVTAAQLQPIKDQLDGAMRDGLTLTAGDQTYQVKGADVALVLYLQPSPAGAALPYQVTVNDNDIARLITKIAHDLDHPAQDAVYRLVDNVVTLVKQPQDGQQVDAAATGAAIKAALLAGQKTAALTLTPLKPAFAATDQAGAIVTPQLLQADSTYYGGSSPERNWNVTLGASKLDGWLIAPGATFSLNDALGDLTLDAGFKMGWAILVQSGSATTIPAEAGGICQVATTLFHPVFWAGLPMVERHHHSYWIGLYGVPPLGMQGLDATISPPDWDFRFKNTTGNWLLIRARGDHTNLRVQLWGTDPGWRVEVSRPVITKPVVTDPIPRRQLTDKLAAGRLIQVEHAQDGFTSDIHRVVYDRAGTKLDDWHAQGTYLPSHNTFMIGTGPSAP